MVYRFKDTALYPPIKAYDKFMLKVSDIHSIAVSQYGNPKGKPVLFVHGGPGGGTDPAVRSSLQCVITPIYILVQMARYFDPKAYRIILVDQRGCGDSTPFANLTDNTTYDSVKDFEKIRNKLGIDKWQVFGGSWGSTLSLAYAVCKAALCMVTEEIPVFMCRIQIEHPDRVSELVLRGIFLLRKKEIDWFYQGPGAGYIFPEEWALYEGAIPKEERGDYIAAYGRRLRGELGREGPVHQIFT